MTRLSACRTMFVAAAALLAWTAVAVGVWVVAAIRADAFPLATPDRAAAAFHVTVTVAGIAAAAFVLLALQATERGAVAVAFTTVATVIAALLAFALADAASAFAGHGPAMRRTAVLLFVGAADCVVAAALGVIAVRLLPRRP